MQELILGESQRRLIARLQGRAANIKATAEGQIAGLQEAVQGILASAIEDAGLPMDKVFHLSEDGSRLVADKSQPPA
jgi:hypothetical protein